MESQVDPRVIGPLHSTPTPNANGDDARADLIWQRREWEWPFNNGCIAFVRVATWHFRIIFMTSWRLGFRQKGLSQVAWSWCRGKITQPRNYQWLLWEIAFRDTLEITVIVQRSAKKMVHGCEKFVPALAYLFCPALPGSCLARFAYFLVDLCIILPGTGAVSSILGLGRLCLPKIANQFRLFSNYQVKESILVKTSLLGLYFWEYFWESTQN